MATDRLRLAELSSADRMAYEIEEGARALGLTLPTQKHVTAVMGLLKRLQAFNPAKSWVSAFRFLPERNNLITSFAVLGTDPERTISGLVLWNPVGGSTSGKVPIPHQLWLVRTDYTQDHEDIVPVGGPKDLHILRTKYPERLKQMLRDWVPVVRYPIAEIPVGTIQCDFDYEEKAPIRTTIHRAGRILIRKTIREE